MSEMMWNPLELGFVTTARMYYSGMAVAFKQEFTKEVGIVIILNK